MPAKKPFQKSKQLQALEHILKLNDGVVVHELTSDYVALNASFSNNEQDILPQLMQVYQAALAIEEENYVTGKKDNTHLPFVQKTTKLVRRVQESHGEQGKKFTTDEVSKLSASFESEFHVNKKLRIAGAVLVGALVVAALVALTVATFGMATTVPLAGVTFLAAMKAFFVAAGAKMLATITGITGSTLGVGLVAGASATAGFTSVIAGLGAKITGDAKQKRLDALRHLTVGDLDNQSIQSDDANSITVKIDRNKMLTTGALGTSVHSLFSKLGAKALAPQPTVEPASQPHSLSSSQ